MADEVRVEGLAELRRGLRRLSPEAAKGLRVALNDAADVVAQDAKKRVPRRSGRAAASIKAASTGTRSRVKEGGSRARYVPWLDFGGRVGRGRSVQRKFYKDGRYLYPAYFRLRDSGEFADLLESAVVAAARRAGLEVG